MANRYIIKVDDVQQKEIKLEADLTNLADGSHVLTVEKYQDTTLLETATRNFTVGTATTVAPDAPTNVRPVDVQATTITIGWTPEANTDYVVVWRRPAGGTWAAVSGNLTTDVITHQSTGLTSGTTYEFRVRAHNSGTTTTDSAILSVTAGATTVLVAPTISFGSLTSGNVVINWSGGANGDRYELKRVIGSQAATIIYSGALVTSYTDTITTTDTGGAGVGYWVEAVRGSGGTEERQWSNGIEGYLETSTEPEPPSGNAIASWGMKETSGAMVDSVNALNGTVGGSMTRNGTHYQFGSNAYVVVPDNDLLTFGDGAGNDSPLTIRMMLNFANTSGTQWILSKRSADGIEYQLALYDSNITAILTGANGNHIGRGFPRTLITTNTWYHLVMTYDGSKTLAGLQLYLNGTRTDDRDTFTGVYDGMKNTIAPVYLGTLYQLAGYYLNAGVRDVRIDKERWTDTKISQDYANMTA